MGPNTLYSMYMQIAGLVFHDLIVYMKNHSDDLNGPNNWSFLARDFKLVEIVNTLSYLFSKFNIRH